MENIEQQDSTRLNYKDRYATQMCHRMTNGFVKIFTHDSINKDNSEINRKIDTITGVTYYKIADHWNTLVTTNNDVKQFYISFDERWKAERLCHELTLIITGEDIVNNVLKRNQKLIDEEMAKEEEHP